MKGKGEIETWNGIRNAAVEFLDTETVTNVPIPSLTQYVRRYTFSMSFTATAP